MPSKQRFLVVVSVLEGRRFPKRPRHKLVAEARFDGELLATDPVEHNEMPDFTQEIAWELDKKGLNQHRLQRSSIKVQLYAVDPMSTMREAIGYVMLDLRSAQNIQTTKWYPLLHSKYSRSKSEVRLGIYIDDDSATDGEGFKAKDAPARVGQPPISGKSMPVINPAQLKPILVEDGAYYQIGPEECSDRFVLSVTIASATNLPHLIPSNQPLPNSQQGYFFYYSLFGNDITNTAFHDLVSPNFPPERASTAIRSSVETLQAFFSRQTGVQIHLCCGEHSLGSCDVQLNDLLKPGSTEIYMNPVVIEGNCSLQPPARVKASLPPYTVDTVPSVGVSIVLRIEEPVTTIGPAEVIAPSPLNLSLSPLKVDSPPLKIKKKKAGTKNVQDEGMSNGITVNGIGKFSAKKSPSPKKLSPKAVRVIDHLDDDLHDTQPSTSTSSAPRYTVPSSVHHYNFSLDLRSLRHIDTNVPLNIYARYSYPFFGSAAPVRTYPSVEINRGTEVTLPQSFCSFDFGTNYQVLEDTFRSVALTVELWDRDKQKDQDTLFGVVDVPLGQLLLVDRISMPSGQQRWKQVYADSLPIHDAVKNRDRGEMLLQMTLEDFGPVHNEKVQMPSSESNDAEVVADPVKADTDKYCAALELEMWKEVQETMFETKLKEKESQHMRALAEEWKRRDRERELLVKKKVGDYNQLEEQLKKTMGDFEKKQKQLTNNEMDVSRLKKDLEREHDRKVQELKEESRRMKEECQHTLELERMKVTDLKEQINRYKNLQDESDKKYYNLDREFAAYREQQNSKPEVRLQSEINLLTLEKVELDRKLDAVTKSKVHYKQQWGRALKELARLKQKEQESARQQLKVQQQELEHMRLRYLAAEEKEVVKTEMKELEDIKNEINRLKEEQEKKKHSPEKENGMYSLRPELDSSFDDHIARLIEERDALLKTGVYTNDDIVISDLDKQIRDAIAGKNA